MSEQNKINSLENEEICSQMIYNGSRYYNCKLMPHKDSYCLCAFFADIEGYDSLFQLVIDKNGKINSVNITTEEMRKENLQRAKYASPENCPNICPLKLSYEEVEKLVSALNRRVEKV
jgi:hypothetical protein